MVPKGTKIVQCCSPIKHEMLDQCCINVGPSSQTTANIKPVFARCLVYTGQDKRGRSTKWTGGKILPEKETLNQCCFNASRRWLNLKPNTLAWCLLGVHWPCSCVHWLERCQIENDSLIRDIIESIRFFFTKQDPTCCNDKYRMDAGQNRRSWWSFP